MQPNDVAPNPPPITDTQDKATKPKIKQTILKFSKSIVCRLIKFNEHLEQGTITKTQPQEPQETRTKMAVGLRRWLGNFAILIFLIQLPLIASQIEKI